MRFVQKPCMDWEPLFLRLVFERQTAPESNSFRDQCTRQLQKRDAESACACQLTFLHVVGAEQDRIELLCEWLCPNCLPGFVQSLEQSFPQLLTIEAGHDDRPVQRSESSFVEIDEQTVELEDGTAVRVGPFKVAQRPIRTREFKEFVDTTGYETSAQRLGDSQSFLNNGTTVGLSKRELAESPVSCVSYSDATAYCNWRGVQLPTEAQWLAASIADSKIHTREEYANQRFWERGGCYLPELNAEWTRTIDPAGSAIIRRGPRWARTTSWREEVRQHRFAVPLDLYDIMTSFRVVIASSNPTRSAQSQCNSSA